MRFGVSPRICARAGPRGKGTRTVTVRAGLCYNPGVSPMAAQDPDSTSQRVARRCSSCFRLQSRVFLVVQLLTEVAPPEKHAVPREKHAVPPQKLVAPAGKRVVPREKLVREAPDLFRDEFFSSGKLSTCSLTSFSRPGSLRSVPRRGSARSGRSGDAR